jgi:hypothetical protein
MHSEVAKLRDERKIRNRPVICCAVSVRAADSRSSSLSSALPGEVPAPSDADALLVPLLSTTESIVARQKLAPVFCASLRAPTLQCRSPKTQNPSILQEGRAKRKYKNETPTKESRHRYDATPLRMDVGRRCKYAQKHWCSKILVPPHSLFCTEIASVQQMRRRLCLSIRQDEEQM